LYLPLNLTSLTPIAECLLQIVQIFSAIVFNLINIYYHIIFIFASIMNIV
jgi:hypothetical protein